MLGKKQHEKCHCHTPFDKFLCAPHASNNYDFRAVSPYASRQSTAKMTNRPILPIHREYFATDSLCCMGNLRLPELPEALVREGVP